MSSWKSVLRGDPTEWLLEEDNPSVRYFTLTEVMGRSLSDRETKEAKEEIMKVGTVPDILARQNGQGFWESPEDFYRPKYRSTVWQLIILAELGADGKNQRIQKACEFILENSQDRQSGGFSYWKAKRGGGTHGGVGPCLTGNMVWSLIRFGFLEDPRVAKAIDWITTYERFDDGIEESPKGWPYDGNQDCFGTHSCHMGVVKALKALAEIPARERSENVVKTIQEGAEYMLKHHIHRRSHNLNRLSKPGWLRFGFPLMYQTDVLEILGIMTRLGYHDNRMQEAVDLVVSKQNSEGRWNMENSFNDRFHVSVEQNGKPSKWITLNALRMLKRYYS